MVEHIKNLTRALGLALMVGCPSTPEDTYNFDPNDAIVFDTDDTANTDDTADTGGPVIGSCNNLIAPFDIQDGDDAIDAMDQVGIHIPYPPTFYMFFLANEWMDEMTDTDTDGGCPAVSMDTDMMITIDAGSGCTAQSTAEFSGSMVFSPVASEISYTDFTVSMTGTLEAGATSTMEVNDTDDNVLYEDAWVDFDLSGLFEFHGYRDLTYDLNQGFDVEGYLYENEDSDATVPYDICVDLHVAQVDECYEPEGVISIEGTSTALITLDGETGECDGCALVNIDDGTVPAECGLFGYPEP